MTESKKMLIRPLDGKSDYTMWRIHVKSAIKAKELDYVFNKPKSYEASSISSATYATTEEQCQKSSNIIVLALADHALSVVRSLIRKQSEMMTKLDAGYDSKSISSRI